MKLAQLIALFVSLGICLYMTFMILLALHKYIGG